MTLRPKTRKAPEDPIFAAIAAVKAEQRRLNRIEGVGEDWSKAWNDWHKAVMRLARTKPATFAGTVAFLDYIAKDAAHPGYVDWHACALKTCAAALAEWEAAHETSI